MQSYTREEIFSQPESWQRALHQAERLRAELVELFAGDPSRQVLFIGCGSSYYLSASLAWLYRAITRRRASATVASEVLFFPQALPVWDERALAVLISRTGRTTETVRAAEQLAGQEGVTTLAVTCEPRSPLESAASRALVLDDPPERSTVMTRQFGALLLLLLRTFGYVTGDVALDAGLARLPELCRSLLEQHTPAIEQFVAAAPVERGVFLGQGPAYGLACEGALKLNEMALTPSNAYHSLEYRHGPISTTGADVTAVILVTDAASHEEAALAGELRSLGARTLVLCEQATPALASAASCLIELKTGLPDLLRVPLYLPVLHLLGLFQSTRRGVNPDSPPHLSRYVTLS
jgi:glucosamine--fructose-6-phosphate aminotransferase (isomerizing)